MRVYITLIDFHHANCVTRLRRSCGAAQGRYSWSFWFTHERTVRVLTSVVTEFLCDTVGVSHKSPQARVDVGTTRGSYGMEKRGSREVLSAAVVHGALLARSAAWHRAGDLRHVGKLGHYRAHAIGMGHMADRKGIQGADRRTITASATGGPAEPHVEFLSISRIPL